MTALSPVTVATELHAIQAEQRRLKEREEELRAVLFDSLKQQGVKSVKLNDGTVYSRGQRPVLKPVPKYQDEAWEWAREHNSLKIDTHKAHRILSRELHFPRFFKVDITEFLVVRRPGQADEE